MDESTLRNGYQCMNEQNLGSSSPSSFPRPGVNSVLIPSQQEYMNLPWAVRPSDALGASIPLREGAGAALHPPQVPKGKAPDLQNQESPEGPVYAVVNSQKWAALTPPAPTS